MSEAETIAAQAAPQTVDSLTAEFQRIGLQEGMTVLVHSSMSKLGWVCGGPVAVVQALLTALGPTGTLMMPTHSGDLSNPAHWAHPPVPESWWPIIRDSMPAYHPAYTPTRGMGRIPEVFRTMPGVLRSTHPTVSFAAYGPHAPVLTDRHELVPCLGDGSPLARLYDLDGFVLLLGVGHGNNTSLHLAEARADHKKYIDEGSPIMENGVRVWKEMREIDWNDDPFDQIGADYEAGHPILRNQIAGAETRLFKQRPIVDFTVDWLNQHAAPAS